MTEPLLELRDLGIAFQTRRGQLPITRDVSFSIAPGERVGLVGESGCGKSVTGLSIMRLLPAEGTRVRGQIRFEGRDILTLPERQMRGLRGAGMAMVFQEPMVALDPVFTVGAQIAEAWLAHHASKTGGRRDAARQARERAIAALAQVGIPAPDRRYHEYPHQLSGGMRQRIMIAMAIISAPRLLIADEPTTALDVTVQAQIMDLLLQLSERQRMALLFITHDLGVVAETCTRMITMYAGQVVEDGPVDDTLVRPRHPYTSGLLRSLPRLSARGDRLSSIPGRVPSPSEMPAGCRYRARCAHGQPGCAGEQELIRIDSRHWVRCGRFDELLLPGVTSA
jgi:peptide/nickel transport system ATP-binding protein